MHLTLYLHEREKRHLYQHDIHPRYLFEDTMCALGLAELKDGKFVISPKHDIVRMSTTETSVVYVTGSSRSSRALELIYNPTENSIEIRSHRYNLKGLLADLAVASSTDLLK